MSDKVPTAIASPIISPDPLMGDVDESTVRDYLRKFAPEHLEGFTRLKAIKAAMSFGLTGMRKALGVPLSMPIDAATSGATSDAEATASRRSKGK